jgi:hypothetical protein
MDDVADMGRMRNAYKILVGKSEEERPFGRLQNFEYSVYCEVQSYMHEQILLGSSQ